MDIRNLKKTGFSKRFIDRKDKKDFIKLCEDFHKRKHGAPIMRVVVYFIVIMLFSIWILNNLISSMLFLPPEEPPPTDAIVRVLGIIIFAAFTAGLVAIFIIYKVRQNVLETEFQSLVFSSGMRVNNDFCLIVHKEKAGFYCDYNFTELFSDYGELHHDPFHQLIASEGFRPSDEDLMLNAMENVESAQFTFTLKRKNSGTKKMTLTIDPLDRPKGFFIIQGTYIK